LFAWGKGKWAKGIGCYINFRGRHCADCINKTIGNHILTSKQASSRKLPINSLGALTLSVGEWPRNTLLGEIKSLKQLLFGRGGIHSLA
jgi:hypothetical protein